MRARITVLVVAGILLLICLVLFIEKPGDSVLDLQAIDESGVAFIIDDSSLFYGHKLGTVMLIIIGAAVIILSSVVIEKYKPLKWRYKILLIALWLILLAAIIFALLMWGERLGIKSIIK